MGGQHDNAHRWLAQKIFFSEIAETRRVFCLTCEYLRFLH